MPIFEVRAVITRESFMRVEADNEQEVKAGNYDILGEDDGDTFDIEIREVEPFTGE